MLRLINSPDDSCCEAENVDVETCVEGHTERVDKEQFKPSAYGNDARNNAIEDDGHKGE